MRVTHSTLTHKVTIRYLLNTTGEDLTHIDIRDGTIVGAGYGSTIEKIYVGQLSYDFWADKRLKVGDRLRISKSPSDSIVEIKYPIAEIQMLKNGKPTAKLVRNKWVAMSEAASAG